MRTEDEVRALLRRMLDRAPGDEAEVQYRAERTIATRFGESAITQNTSCEDETLTLELTFGRRRGAASTNRLDGDAGLDALFARAEAAARQLPEDPELVTLPGRQIYGARPPRWSAATALLSSEVVADDVAQVIAAAGSGFRASGLFQIALSQCGIANSRGLSGWDAATSADYSATLHGPAGSGKAVQSAVAHDRLDPRALAVTAVENARMAQNPGSVDPGQYTVVFEPLAVRGLLSYLPWALDAREADEGASAFADTVGRQLVSSRATIRLDTDDPELPVPTMGRRGQAIQPTAWIEAGVVKRLAHDPFWAAHKGTAPDAAFQPLFMAGGSSTVAELVAGCERGLLVKDLWYIRNVDWKTFALTGMTRDGVHRIEDGRVVGPVRNLRFNESPLTFLRNLTGLSQAVRVGPGMKVPGARSDGFTFTSVTDSV